MTAFFALRAAHLAAEGKRFDGAIEAVMRLLTYCDPPTGKPNMAVRAVTERLLGADSYALHGLLMGPCAAGGKPPKGVHLFTVPFTPILRLEWVSSFVGYELLDDGEPGIAWWRYSRDFRSRVLCVETHKGAHPFLVRWTDGVRGRSGGEAVYATPENVLAALAACIRSHVEFKTHALEMDRPDWTKHERTTAIPLRRWARRVRQDAERGSP